MTIERKISRFSDISDFLIGILNGMVYSRDDGFLSGFAGEPVQARSRPGSGYVPESVSQIFLLLLL